MTMLLAKSRRVERRIAQVALAGQPQSGTIEISLDRVPAWPADVLSLGEAFEIGRAMKEVLSRAPRARSARSRLRLKISAELTGADPLTAEADARAADAVHTAHERSDRVERRACRDTRRESGRSPSPISSTLVTARRRAAAFGIAGAYPALAHDTGNVRRHCSMRAWPRQ